MEANAITFALCLAYVENRQWIDWVSSHVGIILQSWARSVEARGLVELDGRK